VAKVAPLQRVKAYTSDPDFFVETLAKNSGCFTRRRRNPPDKTVDPSVPSIALYTQRSSSAVYTCTRWGISSSNRGILALTMNTAYIPNYADPNIDVSQSIPDRLKTDDRTIVRSKGLGSHRGV
jgi:hypothetical protein